MLTTAGKTEEVGWTIQVLEMNIAVGGMKAQQLARFGDAQVDPSWLFIPRCDADTIFSCRPKFDFHTLGAHHPDPVPRVTRTLDHQRDLVHGEVVDESTGE